MELCRFDLLRVPEWQEWATKEARRSNVVVVSAHGDGELPREVVEWIRSWASQQSARRCVLVASLDEEHRQKTEANRTLASLRKVAADAGLHLLCHFGRSPQREWEFVVRCVRNRSQRASQPEDPGMHPAHGSGMWGINE